MSTPPALGLPPAGFLRKHWQKRLKLTRDAMPQYTGLLSRETLFGIAARDDVQSRLVTRSRSRWHLAYGPFTRRRLARLPGTGWTLLVQGVNHVLPAAQALLLEFSFMPYAHLDDVMVSYAPPGGGVGPHFDSYDGTAMSECMTAAIGFRAPNARELSVRFLEYLQDELEIDGMYRDPDLRPRTRPALIGGDMVRKVRRMLERIRWGNAETLDFLGRYLTEPKPHVWFARPLRPLTPASFARALRRRGARLAPATLMLFRGSTVFINGERCAVGRTAAGTLTRLADRRRLAPPLALGPGHLRWLYQWYRAGYIELNGEA